MAGVVAFALWRLAGGSGAQGGAPLHVDRGPQAAGERAGPGGASRAAGLYVHVAGAVERPGVVRVAPGSRVAGAVARAGGP